MLAARAVKKMKRYWKAKKKKEHSRFYMSWSTGEETRGTTQPQGQMCTWTVTVPLLSLHYLLNPILQMELNPEFVLDQGKRKRRSWRHENQVCHCNTRAVVFQLCNNSIMPSLQREELKSPVVCVILLHTESMILLEAKRLFIHRSAVTVQTYMLHSIHTPRIWLWETTQVSPNGVTLGVTTYLILCRQIKFKNFPTKQDNSNELSHKPQS